uniref:AIG1-type G domain-containing protein n=1 Tax=Kalanchoe fedtschenkoi TaxID=63787 RepID=A0A7N0UX32_KALFE
MKSIGEWIFSQLVSRPIVASSAPLLVSSRDGDSTDSQVEYSGSGDTTSNSLALHIENLTSDTYVENHSAPASETVGEDTNHPPKTIGGSKLDPVSRIQHLQVTFLRLLQRFGLSSDDILVAKVLYRMHLATLIKADDDANLTRADNLRVDKAKRLAAEQEASGLPPLDFSIRVLVLGRTGVGKSATINSIFGQSLAVTDAFQPGTNDVVEVMGTINGVKISVIDTPGLLPLSADSVRRNRKILLSIKRFVRKTPPDIVLYVERLDLINTSCSDLPLLKQITDVFGSGIWFNTILVMTHSSSALPEGPNGYPVNFESYAARCSDVLQNNIHQAVADSRLENPVLLVENHTHCRRNSKGEKILPNGQDWKSNFLLLCLSSKVLGDVNALMLRTKLMEFFHCLKLKKMSMISCPLLEF